MEKFEKGVALLLSKVKQCMDSCELVKSEYGDYWRPTPETCDIFNPVLLDTHILFYEYDPNMPLTTEVEKLRHRVEIGDSLSCGEIDALKKLLVKFQTLLSFHQA